MKQYFRLLSLLLVLMMTSSCSKDDDPVADSPQPQIIFLFSPGGLGDMSYNDCILEGVQRFKLEQPETDIYIYSPESLDEAEKIFFRLALRGRKATSLFFSCFATSDYEPISEKYLKEHSLTANKSILLFESRKRYNDPNIHTFQISMYGASYLAGATAALCCGDKKTLALLANDSDSPIGIARDGFYCRISRRMRCRISCRRLDRIYSVFSHISKDERLVKGIRLYISCCRRLKRRYIPLFTRK